MAANVNQVPPPVHPTTYQPAFVQPPTPAGVQGQGQPQLGLQPQTPVGLQHLGLPLPPQPGGAPPGGTTPGPLIQQPIPPMPPLLNGVAMPDIPHLAVPLPPMPQPLPQLPPGFVPPGQPLFPMAPGAIPPVQMPMALQVGVATVLWKGRDPVVDMPLMNEQLTPPLDGYCNERTLRAGACSKRATYHRSGFLSTCKKHKNQRPVRAARCKAIKHDGSLCNELMRWKPPYYELCRDHENDAAARAQMPCYFSKLPPELRTEIFSYLLPDRPIEAGLTAPLRCDGIKCTLSILRVNRQWHDEASAVLYGSVPYTLAVQPRNVRICGVELISKGEFPMASPVPPPTTFSQQRFKIFFRFSRIQKLRVQFCLSQPGPRSRRYRRGLFDAEVDMYDMRDNIREVLNLTHRQLKPSSLNVVAITEGITFTDESNLDLLRTVLVPFTRLRSIPTPTLEGVYSIKPWAAIPPLNHPALPGTTISIREATSEAVASGIYFLEKHPTALQKHPASPDSELATRYEQECLQFASALSAKGETLRQPCPETDPAFRVYAEIETYYRAVLSEYHGRMPRKRENFLHRARVAREARNRAELVRVKEELEQFVAEQYESEARRLDSKRRRLEGHIRALEAKFKEVGADVLGEGLKTATDADGKEAVRVLTQVQMNLVKGEASGPDVVGEGSSSASSSSSSAAPAGMILFN